MFPAQVSPMKRLLLLAVTVAAGGALATAVAVAAAWGVVGGLLVDGRTAPRQDLAPDL
jgi:hypothetical protein